VRSALHDLVANGAISQSQADTVLTQVEAGSVDPAALVQGGVVDQSQMQAIMAKLAAVKRSLAPGG
jgi:hypothetical protein